MTTYLSDCPAVLKLIETKNYKNKHIKIVVKEYNNYCGK